MTERAIGRRRVGLGVSPWLDRLCGDGLHVQLVHFLLSTEEGEAGAQYVSTTRRATVDHSYQPLILARGHGADRKSVV